MELKKGHKLLIHSAESFKSAINLKLDGVHNLYVQDIRKLLSRLMQVDFLTPQQLDFLYNDVEREITSIKNDIVKRVKYMLEQKKMTYQSVEWMGEELCIWYLNQKGFYILHRTNLSSCFGKVSESKLKIDIRGYESRQDFKTAMALVDNILKTFKKGIHKYLNDSFKDENGYSLVSVLKVFGNFMRTKTGVHPVDNAKLFNFHRMIQLELISSDSQALSFEVSEKVSYKIVRDSKENIVEDKIEKVVGYNLDGTYSGEWNSEYCDGDSLNEIYFDIKHLIPVSWNEYKKQMKEYVRKI